MYLTGFADEAGADIRTQIAVTQQLGWSHIEARTVGSGNIHDIPQDEFDSAADALDEAGIRVNCFGSAIANWGRCVTEPFDITLQAVERAIPRMHRLNCAMIRIMSYRVLKDRSPDDQMEDERFRRLREITRRFLDAGIQPVHENCMNYGGMGWRYTLRMLDAVPGLKLVFDTGNPVFTVDPDGDGTSRQSAWTFYKNVHEHVVYVHIKDGLFDPLTGQTRYTWPGEGDGHVRQIVCDLLARGYDGGFSMEPHMGAVYHEGSSLTESEARQAMYVEYGQRFERLLKECYAP